MEFFWYIMIGLIAGFAAGKITRGTGFGLIVNIVVGIIGGALGGWLFGLMGIPSYGSIVGSLITSTIGAILFLWVISLFRKRE